jgi:hypothetical protein
MMDKPDAHTKPQKPAPGRDQLGRSKVDVEQLADKVYRLMADELRLARARGERLTQRREH